MKDRILLLLLVLVGAGIVLLVEYIKNIIKKNKSKKPKRYI